MPVKTTLWSCIALILAINSWGLGARAQSRPSGSGVRQFEPSPILGNTDVGALKSDGLWIPAIYASRARVLRSPGQDDALQEFSTLLEGMTAGTTPERLLPPNLELRLQAPSQLRHYQHLRFLLGKRAYSSGDYALATRQFASVQPGDFSPRALLYSAAIEVRSRRSVPAISALRRALEELDTGIGGVADAQWLRGTILLSIARIYFASSLHLDPETNALHVDSTRISAAYKYYQQAFPLGGDVPEVAYELALLSHLAGNDPLEAGMSNALLGSGFRSPLFARVLLLRAAHALNGCHDGEAKQDLEAYGKYAGGLGDRLAELLQQISNRNIDNAFASLVLTAPQVSRAGSALDEIVESARRDRAVAGLITWLRRIDEQRGRVANQPKLARSAIGPAALEVLDHERTFAMSRLSNQIREYLEYARDQLLEADADAARLSEYLKRPNPVGRVTQSEARIYGPVYLPNLLHPYPSIPSGYRHLEAGYFFEVFRSECAR